jgi:hypothetical protein
VSACVLDTDVLIAALDRADAHHRAAAEALRVMVADSVPLLVSLINYAETLVRPSEDEAALRACSGIRRVGRVVRPARLPGTGDGAYRTRAGRSLSCAAQAGRSTLLSAHTASLERFTAERGPNEKRVLRPAPPGSGRRSRTVRRRRPGTYGLVKLWT